MLLADLLESEVAPNDVLISAEVTPAVVIQRLVELPIADIVIDAAYQSRVATDQQTIIQYADLVKQGIEFPPIHIVQIPQGQLILVDGYHRVHAHRSAGRERIWARISVGMELDAIKFAATANTLQGLRRTNDDKRKSIEMLLTHPAYTPLSNRAIASRLNVSHKLVATVRAQLENENVIAAMTTRVTKSGRSQRSVVRVERPSGESPSGESDANSPGKLVDATDQESEESIVPTPTQTPTPVGIMETLWQRGCFAGIRRLEVEWVLGEFVRVKSEPSDDFYTDQFEFYYPDREEQTLENPEEDAGTDTTNGIHHE